MEDARVWVSCPGTCGEWIQGVVDGIPLLVSAPVNRYVELEVEKQGRWRAGFWRLPPVKRKVRQALEHLHKRWRVDFGGRIRFRQELAPGKGMASSTADIACAVGGVLALAGQEAAPEELARLALAVEPTDSVMFAPLTAMDYLQGSYIRPLGPAPPATLLVLDCGGRVNTLAFNARRDLRAHYLRHEPEIHRALKLLEEGIADQDLEKMACAATVSARCNLEINPKPVFDGFLRWSQQNGGLGLITAHSGTLLAGIFPERMGPVIAELAAEAEERFHPLKVAIWETVDGGLKIASPVAGRRPTAEPRQGGSTTGYGS